MKAWFIAVLAVALVGCTAAPQADRVGARKPTVSKVGTKTAKSIPPKQARAARTKPVSTTGSVPAVPPGQSDPLTAKAKAAIAAMLDDPAAAEFYNVQRAQKRLLDRRVDAICGHVRTKGASGKSTQRMPFLFIVGHDREDEAYLVTGRSHVAQTVHGALCK